MATLSPLRKRIPRGRASRPRSDSVSTPSASLTPGNSPTCSTNGALVSSDRLRSFGTPWNAATPASKPSPPNARNRSHATAGKSTTDDSPEALRQKQALEYFYNHLTATTALEPDERGSMGLLVRQMMDAVGKRYAVH